MIIRIGPKNDLAPIRRPTTSRSKNDKPLRTGGTLCVYELNAKLKLGKKIFECSILSDCKVVTTDNIKTELALILN